MVSIIIVNWNGKYFLNECFLSLRNQSYSHFEIILVDNGSTDGSIEFVKEHFPEVRILELPFNQGFARGANLGYQMSKGDFIALLNNDAVADEKWLEELIKGINQSKEIGFCSPKILKLFDPSKIDSAGDIYTKFGVAIKRGENREKREFGEKDLIFGASGAGALYRRSMLEDIGFFDEDFFCLYEDVDLSFRAQLAGYQCFYIPTAIVYHHGGGTTGKDNNFTLYFGQRNLELVFFKNMPFPLFLKFLPLHLAYLFLAFVYHFSGGRGKVFLRSKMDVIKNFWAIWRKRKDVQRRKKAPNAYIKGIIAQTSLISYILRRGKRWNCQLF